MKIIIYQRRSNNSNVEGKYHYRYDDPYNQNI